jgi:Ca2+-binding RTX toxin-like protein
MAATSKTSGPTGLSWFAGDKSKSGISLEQALSTDKADDTSLKIEIKTETKLDNKPGTPADDQRGGSNPATPAKLDIDKIDVPAATKVVPQPAILVAEPVTVQKIAPVVLEVAPPVQVEPEIVQPKVVAPKVVAPTAVSWTGTEGDDTYVATGSTPLKLDAGAGNDHVTGGAGKDVLAGGSGIDKLDYSKEGGTKAVNVNLKSGVAYDTFGARDAVSGFEIVIGTKLNDKITGTDAADYLVGGEGNDVIKSNGGFDELYGEAGDDKLYAGDGSDLLIGGSGADYLNGGKGFDTASYYDDGGLTGIVANLRKNTVVDGFGDTDKLSGVESIRGSDFADQITGSNGNNWLRGEGGDDTIDGQSGDDVIWSGFGNDTVLGGKGNDMLAGGHGDDLLDGGKGVDTVDYSNDGGWRGVSVLLSAGSGTDSWNSYDTLVNIENVTGTGFDDWIMGDAKANVIAGGEGDDWLAGGGGADTFVFAAKGGNDFINDFDVLDDTLDLRGLGYASKEDVLSHAVAHDEGMALVFDGGTIVFNDVNISQANQLSILFA